MVNFKIKNYLLFLDLLILLTPIAFIVGPAVINIFSFLFSILFIYFSVKEKNFNWIKNNFVRFFIILWLYFFFKSFLATDVINSLKTSLAFIRFLLTTLIIAYYGFKIINFNKIIKVWFIIILFLCFDIFLQFIVGKNITGNMAIEGRLSGLFGEELIAGSFLSQIIAPIFSYIFYLIFFKNFSKIKKMLLFTFVVFILFTSLITGERMNFIFLLSLYFFLIAIILIFKKKVKFFLFIFLSSLILFIATINFSDYLLNRYNEFKSIVFDVNNSSWGKLYNSAYRLWLKKPIIGYGLKNYRVNCDLELIDINPVSKHQLCSTHPHNLYLEILSETGVIGLILFLSMIYFYFKTLFFKMRFQLNKISVLTIIACSMSIFLILWPIKTSGSFYTSWNGMFLWILMGISLNRKFFFKKYNK